MGFFNFFSKEKKETLDKGLSKTKESVFSKIARAVAGKSKVDDEVLDNLQELEEAYQLYESYRYQYLKSTYQEEKMIQKCKKM